MYKCYQIYYNEKKVENSNKNYTFYNDTIEKLHICIILNIYDIRYDSIYINADSSGM